MTEAEYKNRSNRTFMELKSGIYTVNDWRKVF